MINIVKTKPPIHSNLSLRDILHFSLDFSFAITNARRTISAARCAGLFLQPSDDAPSGWLVLSAFVGLPLALWAYKVRPLAQLVGYES